jgi:hypothetical protein
VHTIIHVDGPRSLEKEAEHKRRDDSLQKMLNKLTTTTKDKLDSGSGLKTVYRMCRSAYRSPPEALEQVLEALENCDWKICRCAHQADCCIASHVGRAPDKSVIRVITNDSDLLAFEDIISITIPAGSGDWKTYFKDELLDKLDLPSPAHLLLVSVVTGNDYTRGVPYYGLASNAAIIRQFDLGDLQEKTGQARLEGFQSLVGEYLSVVKAKAEDARRSSGERQRQRQQRRAQQQSRQRTPTVSKAEIKDQRRIDRAELQLAVTVEDFEGSIRAFVLCQESPLSSDGSRPPCAYATVRSALLDLEIKKARNNSARARRIGVAAETMDTSLIAETSMDTDDPSTLDASAASTCQQGHSNSGRNSKAKTNRTRKHKGPRKNRANRKKFKKWKKSM